MADADPRRPLRRLPRRRDGGLRFLCDAPELAGARGRPWLRAWAAERLDIPPAAMDGGGSPAGPAPRGAGPAGPPRLRLRRHRQRQDPPGPAPAGGADQGRLLGGDARPQGGDRPPPDAAGVRGGHGAGAGDGALPLPGRGGRPRLEPAGRAGLGRAARRRRRRTWCRCWRGARRRGGRAWRTC